MTGKPRGLRGRPRDERASRAIRDAALRQLATIGYASMTMESVATEARVGRATVYRRFSDKADLVTAAIATRVEPPSAPRGAPIEELVDLLERFDAAVAEQCIEVIGCLLASREQTDAMALHRRRVIDPRIAPVRAILARAQNRGHLRPDADLDLLLDMLVGAVFARRIAGVPSRPGWARRSVDLAISGAGGSGAGRRAGPVSTGAAATPPARSSEPTHGGRHQS